jgi:hypothetical protein
MKIIHNMRSHRWHGDLISPLPFFKKGDMAKNKHERKINISTTYSLGKWNRYEVALYHACAIAVRM